MKNPAGQECKYFYGDYFRGKHHEECRLFNDHNIPWEPRLCETCPLPSINRANACEHMRFTPDVHRPFLILKPQVNVSTYCSKSNREVEEPKIGCGQCHQLPEIFMVAPDDDSSSN